MRAVVPALILGVLSACAPQVPNSGIGFDSPLDEARERELELSSTREGGPQAIVPGGVISPENRASVVIDPAPRSPGSTNAASSANLAAETAAALEATSRNSGQAPVQASPSNPAPVAVSNPGISDENDFGAVSARQTIESDAQRIANNRAQYQQVQPTALPSRNGGGGPNIVSYALQTKHPRGTRLYSRSGINLAARAQKACRGYPSADQAQMAFLSRGGPERDRLGLDPDGDGYACAWNPAPFRAAVQN